MRKRNVGVIQMEGIQVEIWNEDTREEWSYTRCKI